MTKHAIAMALILAIGLITAPLLARAQTVQAESPADVDAIMEVYGRVLQAFVDDQGRIDFVGMSEDRDDLNQVVAFVQAISPRNRPDLFPTREHELAYWINAYNAISMHTIIEDDFPDNLGGFKLVRYFIWQKVTVGGEEVSLNDLEREWILPLNEARVHFALNCMVVDCPILPRVPFKADTLEEDLEAAAVFFFNEPRNLVYDAERGRVTLNEIIDFFDFDFEREAGSVLAYVQRYSPVELPDDTRVRYRDYNWDVNYQPGKEPEG